MSYAAVAASTIAIGLVLLVGTLFLFKLITNKADKNLIK